MQRDDVELRREITLFKKLLERMIVKSDIIDACLRGEPPRTGNVGGIKIIGIEAHMRLAAAFRLMAKPCPQPAHSN